MTDTAPLPNPEDMHPFGPAVQRFDDWVDDLLEQLRGKPAADRLFTTATHLADWSLVWHLVGALRGLTSERRAQQAFELSALLGLESLLVNQGIKRLFRRSRPTTGGDERFEIRRPSTTSFPSGHASAAFFAAALLTSMSGRRMAPVWYGLAGVIALSRPYVRIHHASDMVGGAAIGLALGRIAVAVRRSIVE